MSSLLLVSACTSLPGEPRGVSGAEGASALDTSADRAETEAALAILERMSRHLASLGAFRFAAEVRYDAVQASGQRIEFGSERRIAVRRPDRLRVEVADWDGPREWVVYDGARVSAASPSQNVYASIEQTGSFEQALARLDAELGVPMPLAELFEADVYAKLATAVKSGARVGTVRLDGRPCDQLAFRTPSLDFQIFVEQGDAPRPRRLVIDYHEEPGSPQFRADLHGWESNVDLPDNVFYFSPPVGAQRIPFDEFFDLLFGMNAGGGGDANEGDAS